MDCGRTSISLSPEEQLPVFRGRLSRIRESDGVLPNSYFGANSRTAEFQHSHLGDIDQKHAILTNSRIRVGEHRRIAISPTSSGRTPSKGPDWLGLPDSNRKHHSADRSDQISPPTPPTNHTAPPTQQHNAAHQPTAPQRSTAAPPASRGSDSARAAGGSRRTPAATPVRRWPGRACPQRGTASHTRTRRTQSRAHR